jgi:hypothetical protein
MKADEISAVKEKTFQKDFIFRKFFIIFSMAFFGPRRLGALPRHHKFRKPQLLLQNNLGKPLRNFVETYHFMSGFPKLFYV